TDPLPYNATALAIQQALAGLPTIANLSALPVTATTTMGLTVGVELTATPQSKLGLLPSTIAGAGIDPDLIVTAPLQTRPVTAITLSDNAASSTLIVNGRRLDFTVPPAANLVRLDGAAPVRLDLTLSGLGAASFKLVVNGTDVAVNLPATSLF